MIYSLCILFPTTNAYVQSSVFMTKNYTAPTVVLIDDKNKPQAIHQLVVVDVAGSILLRLKSYSSKRLINVVYYINSLPTKGSVYQLSQVFSAYGIEPKKGDQITKTKTVVTGSNSRILYVRPSPDFATYGLWDVLSYYINSKEGIQSTIGTITLVPPSGVLVGSDFLLSSEQWTINGNKVPSSASYEPYSRGNLLNRYITGTDDIINVARTGGYDLSLWYFTFPNKFLQDWRIAYGGKLSFNIGAFSGDFSNLNDPKTSVVELSCASCQGPISPGITLGISIKTLQNMGIVFNGQPITITINLLENGGWLKDSQNQLAAWTVPSQCDMVKVLTGLSGIRILGDWTTWYESVAIDNVNFSNLVARLPFGSKECF